MASGVWVVVIKRCIRLLARLQQGVATKEELLKFYSEGKNLDKQFQHDLERLRDKFDVSIYFDFSEKVYRLDDLGDFKFLSVSDSALASLAFLDKTFPASSPHYHQVKALLDQLKGHLPSHQLEKLAQDPAALILDLRQWDSDFIPDILFRQLNRAYRGRRLVEFQYRSPQYEALHTYVVEPHRIEFDVTRGHHYLKGFCRSKSLKQKRLTVNQWRNYRLGRIEASTFQVLPSQFSVHAPRSRIFEVQYWLSPAIARYGVTKRFEQSQIEEHPDGSVTISALTDDLFSAVRQLTYYGSNCRVLGGKEILAEFKHFVQAMSKLYEN